MSTSEAVIEAAPEKDRKAATKASEPVLQVERRDFTQLVPTDRARVQSMRGFDPIYTDIVDYIVRCTHKIWDERDVGLIYTHYTQLRRLHDARHDVRSRDAHPRHDPAPRRIS